MNTEVSSILKEGKVYDVAEKIMYSQELNKEDKDIFAEVDNWAKNLTKSEEHALEVSEFIERTIVDEYNTPDELLDQIFERGTIGEFDDSETDIYRNGLEAHEAGKGGTVEKSFIDLEVAPKVSGNLQIDTSIKFSELRRNGFVSLAQATTYAKEKFNNKLFYNAFKVVDDFIVAGDQIANVTGAVPTMAEMDKLALYLVERAGNDSVIIGLPKYAQSLARMSGHSQYMSNNMKDQFNRYGLVDWYGGCRIANIRTANKLGETQLILPAQRMFGCAGKIGRLDMRGDIRVETERDVKNDKLNIYFKDFSYDVVITTLKNCAKATFTA